MKFNILKWSIRLWDLVVFLFLAGYFFLDGFRALFDSSPYLVKAFVWTGVVLFFYYSIIAWYKTIKRSLVNVINSREFKEAKTKEELEAGKSGAKCSFTTHGSNQSVEDGNVEEGEN
jgi:hypothetical protein